MHRSRPAASRRRDAAAHLARVAVVLVALLAPSTAFAQTPLRQGEAVVITTLAGEECNGVVESVQQAAPTAYSVKWTCRDGSQASGLFYREGVRRPSEQYPPLQFKVGDRVDLPDGYKGTVVAVRPGGYKIKYDGKDWELWSSAHEVRAPAGAPKPAAPPTAAPTAPASSPAPSRPAPTRPAPSAPSAPTTRPAPSAPPTVAPATSSCGNLAGKVEVLSGSHWHAATILSSRGGAYTIHYDGNTSTFDERVTVDRIRPRGAKLPCGTPPAGYTDDHAFYVGE